MTPVTSPVNASAAQKVQSKEGGDLTAAMNGDFETFLTMLTVQMKNQDPLNPIESSDYALQLATFSGVEQQVKTNDLLKSMGVALRSDGLNAISGWIGREVATVAPAQFDGSPIDIQTDIAVGADSAALQVLDADGTQIDRISLANSAQDYRWTGALADSTAASPGLYSFRVLSYKDGELQSEAPAPAFQTVREVRMTPDGGELILKGGSSILANEVSSLRAPGG